MRESKNFTWLLSISFIVLFITFNNSDKTICPADLVVINPITHPLPEAIQEGFSTGNVNHLFPHFDELISICIEEEEEPYLAYNAQTPLQLFFDSYPPKQFVIKHHGTSSSGRQSFWIGIYDSTNNKNFRIQILAEEEFIQYIAIEEDLPSSTETTNTESLSYLSR